MDSPVRLMRALKSGIKTFEYFDFINARNSRMLAPPSPYTATKLNTAMLRRAGASALPDCDVIKWLVLPIFNDIRHIP